MNIEQYRTQIRLLLGDVNGRRYADDQLDLSLKQALETAAGYLDERSILPGKVYKQLGRTAVINMAPPPGTRILSVRRKDTQESIRAYIRTQHGSIYLDLADNEVMLQLGEAVEIETAKHYTIQGADWPGDPFPDPLALTLVTGAAGYALLLRARSVTEVFGKRPEDRAALTQQGEDLIRQFVRELDAKADAGFFGRDPWPQNGFPI